MSQKIAVLPNHEELVGGFNPFEKYSSNWIISPSNGENKKKLKPPPRLWEDGYPVWECPKKVSPPRPVIPTQITQTFIWNSAGRGKKTFQVISHVAWSFRASLETPKSDAKLSEKSSGWKMSKTG